MEILKQNFVEEKCGILHCSMNNLIPLGVSDEKWPKFSCDRLIEELKKYPIVYLLKCVCYHLSSVLLTNSRFSGERLSKSFLPFPVKKKKYIKKFNSI